MRWAGHVARMGEKRNACRMLMGKPLRGRRCSRWIILDVIETGWDGKNWIDLAQDRNHWRTLVNTAIKLRVT
jgi:hypothetical protein